jgi:hypothetical protein
MSEKAPLRYKICGLCEQPLEQARKGHCARIWRHLGGCVWVPLLAAYQPATALRIAGGETQDWLNALPND